MAGLINQLIDVITDQLPNYDELTVLSEAKRSVIINNDAEGLQRITSDENAIVGRLQKLDKSRVSLMNEIAIVLNVPGDDLTLTELCELIKEQNEYEPLLKLIEATKQKLAELKTINTINKELVENSLEFIDFSVNVMRSSRNPDKQFYDTSGDEIAPGGGFFDTWQ